MVRHGTFAVRASVVTLIALALSLTIASASERRPAAAATPTPSATVTQTPMASATQVTVALEQPGNLTVTAGGAQWTDRSTGEQGYRVTFRRGATVRVVELPPDATRVDYPSDLRPSCGPEGGTVQVSVVAFNGAQVGPAAEGSAAFECPPATSTPSPRSSPRLPDTGSGSDGPTRVPLIAELAMAAGIALSAAAAAVSRR
jgi:hypothetical protein